MPEKNPDVWAMIWSVVTQIFTKHNQPICSAITAFILSMSRSFLYGKEGGVKRRCVEAVMCGLLASCTRPVLQYFHLEEMMLFVGAIIGLFGIDVMRNLGLKMLKNRLGGQHDKDNQ